MSIGKIGEFKVHADDWRLYVERLEQYFIANGIASDKQVPTLITVMGAECYELLVNLCTPKKPTTHSFQEITAILEKHLQPKPSVLAERFKFRQRKQGNGENLAEYVAVLKRMSKTCEFGNWLEESLRDQLVCGISSEVIRQRLFTEDTLDFVKAYRMAVSMEAAEKDAAVVEGRQKPIDDVKQVDCQVMAGMWQRNAGGARAPAGAGEAGPGASALARPGMGAVARQAAQQQCTVCGSTHVEAPAACKFVRYVCRVCNQIGHLQRVCPNLAGHHNLEVTADAGTDSEDSDEEFSSRYCKVFEDGLGRFTGGRVGFHLRPGARPVFLRARPLAYALREPVERALEQLVRDGVLTPVDRSDWATPIVPVVKKDAGVTFEWNMECQAAFDQVKRALGSSEVLIHYSTSLPLVLTADASGVGVAAVISHLTPQAWRSTILKQLHASHMGIVKTKALARSYVWWPGLDAQVEELCQRCETCAAEAPAPPRAPPAPWPYTAQPWTRIHLDFLGPYKSKTFLVLIDSSTKWLEIFEMARTNAMSVIKVLRESFARFGLPVEVVSDQGPPFTSSEFCDFLKHNGIRQSFSPVYHPSSNGAAENAVKLCKRAIKKAYRDNIDVEAALQTYLMAYRTSPHSTTGESPAMLLQRRSLRTRLDLLRSEGAVEGRVKDAQTRQVRAAGGVARAVAQGEPVWARSYSGRDRWVEGTVAGIEGGNRYAVDNGDGRLIHRHIDQIRRRSGFSNVTYPDRDGDDGSKSEGGENESSDVGAVTEAGEKSFTNTEGSVVDRNNKIVQSVAPPPSPRPTLRPLPHRIRKQQLEID
ncbi:uncharacterized protein [Choristoneura fumiferana]|uniref:uncharacterized protein n=1 Tax=Choristoneura fumiferana TaxID=7141 RepID=UPI003D15757A